jgi:phosphotransferase system  glucose/maltose/N-acetylglucosamine-specific IIC component
MSLAWLFSLAYTVFDKVFPAVLPEPLVTSFSFLFLALVLLFFWQSFSRKRAR